MDCIVHGTLQARILEWVAFPFSRGSFPTQGLNPGTPRCRLILYQLSHKGSPRILVWVAYPFSSGSSQFRDWTEVSCIAGGFFTNWATRDSSFSSVAQLCLNLCDPMNCSTPGFPLRHQLPELAQTQVHWVGKAIQPSDPLSSPSLPTFNLPRNQGLFKWVSPLHQVAEVLELQLQHQSF